MNYFEIFNLKPSFDLDLTALDRQYFALQQQFHPDKMASGLNMTMLSMNLNEAYTSLKSPLKRAEHLLALSGIIVNQDGADTIKPSQALLNKIMEYQEQLADNQLTQQELLTQQSKSIHNLISLFAEAQLEQAAQETIYLRYISKLLSSL